MTQSPIHSSDTAEGAKGPWRVALVAVLLLLTLAAAAAVLNPAMVETLASSSERLIDPPMRLYEIYGPPGLRPLIEKGAAVFLSPWLYLLMAVVFIAEKALPADRRQRVFSVGMIQDFVGWFVIGGVVRVVTVGVLVSGLYWFCNSFLAGLRIEAVQAWPIVIVSILAVLVGDLLNWFHHFIRHKIAVFWLFHTIHHSQQQMNMFTDLRVHLVEYVIAKPITILPLFILGLDVELAFWLTLVLESYARIYHGNLRTNYGPLRYVLVTPQSHRVHHSVLSEHADKNFAVVFSFWDRLFGTQCTDYDVYPPTGVDDASFPHERTVGGLHIITNYFWQLAYPFQMIWAGRRCGGKERGHDGTSEECA